MSFLSKLNPKNWFPKKAIPVVTPEPEPEAAPEPTKQEIAAGTFIETVALAQWSYFNDHRHFMPIRDGGSAAISAWKRLGLTPPDGMTTWVKTYCNEWGDGFEIWQRRNVDGRIEARMFHVGPDKTRESQVAWIS